MELTGHAGKVRSIAYSKKLNKIISGGEDVNIGVESNHQGTVLIHSLPELTPVDANRSSVPTEDPDASITDHNGIVLGVAVSDEVDGTHYMASVGNDYALYVYNITGRVRRVWDNTKAHNGLVWNS